MSDIILQIEHLKKYFRSYWTYRKVPAVHDLSLEVRRGEAFGFLGSNGAGKTTTIKCIVGIVFKNAGRILFNGEELTRADQHATIGYLPEHPYFYDHLSVEESLSFFAHLLGLKRQSAKRRVQEVMELVEIEDRKYHTVRSLSKGWQQRLGFAQAILNRPELLILDEPFSGLDPVGRRHLRRLIMQLKSEGTTVFMSSHILSDVEDICERVTILKAGETKASFSIRDTPELFGEKLELRIRGLSQSLREDFLKACLSHQEEPSPKESIDVFSFASYQEARQALASAIADNARVLSFQSEGVNLEDIFITLTEEPALEGLVEHAS